MKGVISVGSNYVHLAKEYQEWLKRGATHFLLFEPVQETYDLLLQELYAKIPPDIDARTDTRKIALGNTTGRVTMNIEKNNKGQSSSILKPKLHLTQYPWIKFTDTEDVNIDLLDNIVYDRMLYDFLHIDTQGSELMVLQGAVESLRFIEEVEVEVNRAELYEGCPMIEDIDSFLQEQGFERVGVDWFGTTFGDAIYKREKHGIVTKF
jgi:FkbM family methyltransferase